MNRLAITALLLWASTAPSVASAFDVETLSGERTSLEAELLPGGWTLVQLWTSDCVPCERDKPALDRWHRRHSTSATASVLGLALDGRHALTEIEAARARTPTSYATLVAFDDVFAEQYRELTGNEFRATPTYLLYSPAGAFSGVHVGPIDESALDSIAPASEGTD